MATTDVLACIARQERELRFDGFSDDDAWLLGCRLRAWASERGAAVVIDIRRFDRQVFFAALPGAVPDNSEWVRRKSNVVLRFHRSSYGMGLQLAQDGTTLAARYGLDEADYAAHGGSFPILVHGVGVIGSVTTSGLPQRADHEAVIGALCGVLGRPEGAFALPAAD